MVAFNTALIPLPPLTVIVGADKYPEPPLVTVTVSIDASMIVAIVAGSSCDND